MTIPLDDQVIRAPPQHHCINNQISTSASEGTHNTHTRAAVCIHLLLGLRFSRMKRGASSSPWECEPPCPTWVWLHQTPGEGPALPVPIGLLGHLEAQASVRISWNCQPGAGQVCGLSSIFSLEFSYTGETSVREIPQRMPSDQG